MHNLTLLNSFAKPIIFGAKLARHLGNNRLQLAWMKNDIMKMGPAYVKIGQFVAAREDVFPSYITSELGELHDNVTPIDFGIIQQTIEHEYNSSMDDVFLRAVKNSAANKIEQS